MDISWWQILLLTLYAGYQILDELEINSSAGSAVFADLYGGTPCNVAAKMLLSGSNFKLYTGMNMAMIIDYLNAALLDTKPDPIKGGTQGICDVNASLQKLDGEDE
ncbi:sugar phosphotransferase system (PTS), fructose family, IIA component [Ligilactobacillus acidipiscis DSM 15836]|uniref:Sugar phosphotransferase system (PTS), fructose family, IIA component n=1 Tax=Ligilactobacillus acidipiscis DSM 15836 TaxID=1423716 RepID=A0ABR5PNS9_9LACO|nr:hypothetical protein [Ligilactobacillus acidipiscis]KRM31848.1 sugar phosphotransferase system (PTS), fructose family, IIA component [Ligilactobacillus acidipiscis DSM 15836]GAW64877.1 mannose/fructose/sorbose-specific PTS system IIA component [Ligilactobacillus acidipiscis]GEN20057.1 hypothetical protein LAC02_33380 [Ligilactobacillus acidipiscis]